LAGKVENTARYQELFCTAFDTALSKIEAIMVIEVMMVVTKMTIKLITIKSPYGR
jgi:hypothetical protein